MNTCLENIFKQEVINAIKLNMEQSTHVPRMHPAVLFIDEIISRDQCQNVTT